MTKKGRAYGEFEIEHPTKEEIVIVHAYVDYSQEDDTYDTQGSLDWDYKIEWVEDENGKECTDTTWLTYEMMSGKLEDILIDGLND